MSDDNDDDRLGFDEAFDGLTSAKGQGYLKAENAWKILREFAGHVEVEFVEKHDPNGEDIESVNKFDKGHALSHALEDEQRSSEEARGLVNTLPHEMLVTYSDVSGILVEALGGEPSDITMGGSGFTADSRHDENCEKLRELLGEPAPA